jgi:hypothetical protein
VFVACYSEQVFMTLLLQACRNTSKTKKLLDGTPSALTWQQTSCKQHLQFGYSDKDCPQVIPSNLLARSAQRVHALNHASTTSTMHPRPSSSHVTKKCGDVSRCTTQNCNLATPAGQLHAFTSCGVKTSLTTCACGCRPKCRSFCGIAARPAPGGRLPQSVGKPQ